MADKAHRLTDEKLEEMEKRLSAIYSRAEKEIQKTADEYFSKFAKQDEAKRKLVEQGKLTNTEKLLLHRKDDIGIIKSRRIKILRGNFILHLHSHHI